MGIIMNSQMSSSSRFLKPLRQEDSYGDRKIAKKPAFTIGVVNIDYPDVNYVPGDPMTAESYPSHTHFVMESVKGLTFEVNKAGEWNANLEREMAKTLRTLEARGASALIGSSGFLFLYNEHIVRMTKLPVLMSAVNLLPVIQQTLRADEKKILVLTNNARELQNDRMRSYINRNLCLWSRERPDDAPLHPRLVLLDTGQIESHKPIAAGTNGDREAMGLDLIVAVE